MAIVQSTLTVTDAFAEKQDLQVTKNTAPATPIYSPNQTLLDTTMTPINPATSENIAALSAKLPAQVAGAVPIINKGSAGADVSLYGTTPTWPHLGQPIVGAPFDGWVHIGDVDLTGCAGVHIENYAGEVVLMLQDDNVAAGANAPQNATAFVLPFGIAGGAAPERYVDDKHKGRIQLYAQTALVAPAYIAIRKL